MNINEEIDIIRIAAPLVLLAIAARSDWKTRTAEDWIWMVMGAVGIGCLGAQMLLEGWEPSAYMGLALVGLVYADIFWDRKQIYDREKRGVGVAGILALVLGIILLIAFFLSPLQWERKAVVLGVVGMVYLFYLFYLANLIHGGADSKALMVLAMTFPVYPHIASLPFIYSPELMEMAFPFAFLVLFNAALVTLVVPVALLAYNIRKGHRKLPNALLGYKKDITTDPPFCWPMDGVEEGEIRTRYFPKKNADTAKAFQELRERGVEEAWVTPKIPFLIPLWAGLLISLLLGNLFGLWM